MPGDGGGARRRRGRRAAVRLDGVTCYIFHVCAGCGRPVGSCEKLLVMWDADTSAFAAAVAQVVTAAVAVLAAAFAGWQVLETRRTRHAQAQAFVVVDVVPGNPWMNWLTLVVENIGTTLARDVRITFNPPVTTAASTNGLVDSVLLREGVSMLPPGRRIETLFDLSHDRLEQRLPMRYEVTVTFSDFRGHEENPLTYQIDLSYLYDLEPLGERTTHHLVEEVSKLRQEVERWRDAERGLLVRRPSDARRQRVDEQWQYALSGTRRSMAHPSLRPGFAWPGRIAAIRVPWLAWRHWHEKRRKPRSGS